MKNIFLFSTLFLALNSLATTTKDEVKKDTSQATTTVKQYTKEQKNEFVSDMKINLERIKQDIAELKASAANKNASVRKDMKKDIAKLEKEQEKLSQKMAKLETDTDKAWDEIKVGVDKSWNELSNSYERAKTKYSQEQ